MELDRRKFVTSAGAVAATVGLAGCAGGGGNETGTETEAGAQGETQTGSPQEGDIDELEGKEGQMPNYLKLTNHFAYVSGDNVGVVGTLKNVGDQPLNEVEVEVTLRDGDTVIGEFIDTSEEEIETLRPGNSWRFNVVFEDENLAQGTGYTVSADAQVGQEADG